MHWQVMKVEVCGPHSLRLSFRDGTRKRVNLASLLKGPMFRPLRDPKYFRKVSLDRLAGVPVWPNGADIAPETLYALPDESHDVVPAKSFVRKTSSRPKSRSSKSRK